MSGVGASQRWCVLTCLSHKFVSMIWFTSSCRDEKREGVRHVPECVSRSVFTLQQLRACRRLKDTTTTVSEDKIEFSLKVLSSGSGLD